MQLLRGTGHSKPHRLITHIHHLKDHIVSDLFNVDSKEQRPRSAQHITNLVVLHIVDSVI